MRDATIFNISTSHPAFNSLTLCSTTPTQRSTFPIFNALYSTNTPSPFNHPSLSSTFNDEPLPPRSVPSPCSTTPHPNVQHSSPTFNRHHPFSYIRPLITPFNHSLLLCSSTTTLPLI